MRRAFVFRAVCHPAGRYRVFDPAGVHAAVRACHHAEKPRNRPAPAHVRRHPARPSAGVSTCTARLLAPRPVHRRHGVLRGRHARACHRRAASRQPGEHDVHARLPCCRRRRAGAVAVQERAYERQQRLSRGVSHHHHVVSAAAVFGHRLRALAGCHPVRRVQRGHRAYDDPMRASLARPRHQPRVHLRLRGRRGVRAARRGISGRHVRRANPRHRHGAHGHRGAGGRVFAGAYVLHRAGRLQARAGRRRRRGHRAYGRRGGRCFKRSRC